MMQTIEFEYYVKDHIVVDVNLNPQQIQSDRREKEII